MLVRFQDYGGHMIIDDNTGRILSIVCMKDGKSDGRAFCSYSRKGGKHYKLEI